MLAFALGRLRWPPDAVWRATPREIAAALGTGVGRGDALRTGELDALMRLFPDAYAPATSGAEVQA